jgi:hypothetical protein
LIARIAAQSATKSASALRVMLDHETTALPPRLQVLMLRLAAQDLAGSTSIASAIDDMARDEVADDRTGPILAA